MLYNDSADICDLIGLYMLDTLKRGFPSVPFGLYRDDALALSRGANGHTLDKLKKDLISTLSSIGIKITIETNLTAVNFLKVTLDLDSSSYRPYHKPNERLSYINTASCLPIIVFKNLGKGVSKRISNLF